jgi:hypothetical protein
MQNKLRLRCDFTSITDRVLGQQSVSTLKFVLFLFIQKMQKISLRSNLLSGDEYPFIVLFLTRLLLGLK